MGTPQVSQRRIDANRRNALRSTGPRTDEGKARSRRNSLIHGLAGQGVVLPENEAEALAERTKGLALALQPSNELELMLVETAAVESLRIDRCRLEDRLARGFRARIAEDCWDDERKAGVARKSRSLAAHPAEVAAELAGSAPGCDWLIGRWRMLGHVLDRGDMWSVEQVSMALDMLGIDPELRDEATPLDAPDDADPFEHLQALVDDQLERLTGRLDRTLGAVESEMREATMAGLNVTDDPGLKLIRRYELASMRRMRWAVDLLNRDRPHSGPPDEPAPEPENRRDPAGAERTQRGGSVGPHVGLISRSLGPRIEPEPPLRGFDSPSDEPAALIGLDPASHSRMGLPDFAQNRARECPVG